MKNRLRFALPIVLIAVAIVFVTRRSGAEASGLFASGTVEATTADLGFPMPGRIATMTATEGSTVAAGSMLASLDTNELEATRAAAVAMVRSAEAALAEMRSGSRPQQIATAEAAARSADERTANAEREVERARALFSGGAVSRQALDAAETALRVAQEGREQAAQALMLVRAGPRRESIRAQEARVEQAVAQLERTEATLSNARISAPFDGVVTVRHREPGEIVPAGAPVATLLDRGSRWVRIYVREDEIGRVSIGQRATIVSDSYSDRSYEGEVTFIGSEAEFTPRNVQTAEERTKLVYPVKVRITGDPDFELKPGVPADVTLEEPGS